MAQVLAHAGDDGEQRHRGAKADEASRLPELEDDEEPDEPGDGCKEERQRVQIAAPDFGDRACELVPAMPGNGDLQGELWRLSSLESRVGEGALDRGVVAALVEERDELGAGGGGLRCKAEFALVVLAGLFRGLARGVKIGHEFIGVGQRADLMGVPEQIGAGLAVILQHAFGVGQGHGFGVRRKL